METRANHVLIGSFVLTALATAFIFALWLGQVSLEREYDFYEVVFDEPVTGLVTAGDVRFNGIKVGEVVDLTIDRADPRITHALVRVDAGTPVKVDSAVTLELQGITGLSYILISGGGRDRPNLIDVSDEDPPVLSAELSELQRLLSQGGETVGSLNDAILRVQDLLSARNVNAIRAILENLADVTQTVAARREEIDGFLRSAASASARLDAASEDLARLAAALSASAEDDIPAALMEARLAAESLRRSTDALALMLEDASPNVRGFAEEGLPELTAAVAETRDLIATLNRLGRRLEANPARFLSGAPNGAEYEGRDE